MQKQKDPPQKSEVCACGRSLSWRTGEKIGSFKKMKIIFTETGVINFNALKEMVLKVPPAVKSYI